MWVQTVKPSFGNLYPGTAMDRMVAEAKHSAGPLNEYYFGHSQGAPQMIFEPVPPFYVMTEEGYRPGIFFNARA